MLEVKQAHLLLDPTRMWLPLLFRLAEWNYRVLLPAQRQFTPLSPLKVWLMVEALVALFLALPMHRECLEN